MKKDTQYIARIFTRESAENFEKLLQGKPVEVLGNVMLDNEILLSEKTAGVDVAKASNTLEKLKWEENAKATAKVNSYFMIGDSLEEVANNIIILSGQPTSESAYSKITNGSIGTKEDYFGGDRVSLCIIEVPTAYLEELITQGYAEKHDGLYGVDSNKQMVAEFTIGDEGLRKLIHEKGKDSIVVYDEVHKAMSAISSIEYDPYHIFDSNYVPEITMGTTQDVEQKIINKELDDALVEMRSQFERGEITRDQYELFMSAFNDAASYFKDDGYGFDD